MSNSIWKTPDQKPDGADTRKQILFYAGGSMSFLYLGWHYPDKGFGSWNYDDIQQWAYLEDVLAQADKAERLQKAVDLAVGALKKINETYEEEYYKGDDEHDSCDWLNCADDMDDLATDVIDEIKQLIKD